MWTDRYRTIQATWRAAVRLKAGSQPLTNRRPVKELGALVPLVQLDQQHDEGDAHRDVQQCLGLVEVGSVRRALMPSTKAIPLPPSPPTLTAPGASYHIS